MPFFRTTGGRRRKTTPVPVPPAAAAPVLGVPAVNGDGSVDLTWTHPGASTYEVYRDGVLVGTTSALTYKDYPLGAPAPPSSLLASLDAESGYGIFSPQSDGAGSPPEHTIRIVTDPTPGQVFGGGKVLAFTYYTTGFGADVNNAISLHPSNLGLSNVNGRTFGERFYVEGELYMPGYPYGDPVAPLQDLRKLLYIKFGDWDVGSQRYNVIVNSYGRADKSGVDLGIATGIQALGNYQQEYGLGLLAFGQKHKVGLEIQTNTEGAANAVVTLWLNDVQVYQRSGFTAVLRPTSAPSRAYWYGLEIGSQEQWGGDAVMQNVRYWDNIKFYSTRP